MGLEGGAGRGGGRRGEGRGLIYLRVLISV